MTIHGFPKRITATAALAIVLLALTGYFAQQGFSALRESVQGELHSQEVRLAIASMLEAVQGAQGAQRGYVISGNALLLSPFETHSRQAANQLASLRRLTEDNASQQRHLDLLTQQWRERDDFAQRVIEIRREGRPEEAMQLVATGVGTSLTQQIGHTLQRMEIEEVGLLEVRRARARRYEALLGLSLAALGAMGALLVSGLYLQAKAEIRRRGAAAAELAEQKAVVETQLEELRTAKERLESVERAKTALLATASHELRTPLNHIIGFSSLLLEGLAGVLNREQAKQVGMIRHSGHQLLGMVTNMLDVASVEAGSMSLNLGPVRLRPMLQELCTTHAVDAAPKGVSVRLGHCEPALVVKADASRLYQILDNLLSNAVKFTPRGAVHVAVAVQGQAVRVTVKDGGAGIAPEQQARLFEPFQRASEEMSRVHPGLGLGLSVSRRLVRIMGGDMGVDSRLGAGSSFWFEVPLAYVPEVVVTPAITLRAV